MIFNYKVQVFRTPEFFPRIRNPTVWNFNELTYYNKKDEKCLEFHLSHQRLPCYGYDGIIINLQISFYWNLIVLIENARTKGKYFHRERKICYLRMKNLSPAINRNNHHIHVLVSFFWSMRNRSINLCCV
jgi:hypothetical protein